LAASNIAKSHANKSSSPVATNKLSPFKKEDCGVAPILGQGSIELLRNAGVRQLPAMTVGSVRGDGEALRGWRERTLDLDEVREVCMQTVPIEVTTHSKVGAVGQT
jgi:hypothetical protein